MEKYKRFELVEGFKFNKRDGGVSFVGLVEVEGKAFIVEDYYYFGVHNHDKFEIVKLKEVKRMKEFYINRGYKLIQKQDLIMNGSIIYCGMTDAYIEVIDGVWCVGLTDVHNNELVIAKDYEDAWSIYQDSKEKYFKLDNKGKV